MSLSLNMFGHIFSLVDGCFPECVPEAEAYEMVVSILALFPDFSEVPVSDPLSHRCHFRFVYSTLTPLSEFSHLEVLFSG